MSTRVRKFLLGASLIWRLKSFQESSDENGKGVVGHSILTTRTRRAIERAQALNNKEERGDDDSEGKPSKATPKKGRPSPHSGFEYSSRIVIDSSPGGIRDAIHVGIAEDHNHYDAASRFFKGSSSNKRARSDSANNSNDSPFQSAYSKYD